VSAARATADAIGAGVDVAAIEFLDAATMRAIARFSRLDLVEAPSLLVEVHGSAAGADETWQVVADVAAASGGAPIALPDPWSIREQATRAIEAARPAAATVRADLAIPIGALPELVAACERIARERGFVVHCFGHAGIGILHALVLADDAEQVSAQAACDSLVETALGLGGSCSGEHGMGLGNRRYAAREHGAALALMQGVKALFDPHGILNPGKMW
jgi:D-lactate dehydrogenase (cytochrome)